MKRRAPSSAAASTAAGAPYTSMHQEDEDLAAGDRGLGAGDADGEEAHDGGDSRAREHLQQRRGLQLAHDGDTNMSAQTPSTTTVHQ